MPKLFPRTNDGDQLVVEFDYQQEADAFSAAMLELGRMRDALLEGKSTEEFDVEIKKFPYNTLTATIKPGKNLLTTLQVEVLKHHKQDAAKILGVHVCNVFGRDSIFLSNFVK